MASFIIECPDCGTYTTASKILHRNVTCGNCGREISVKRDKIAVKECPRCKNNVVYDQSKGEKAVCPVCKEPINTTESKRNALDVHCPSCSCALVVDKNAEGYTCPLCDHTFDVQKQIAKETAKKSVLLRLPPSLHNQIAAWAEEDFRSINGQIEFLLSQAVVEKYKKK